MPHETWREIPPKGRIRARAMDRGGESGEGRSATVRRCERWPGAWGGKSFRELVHPPPCPAISDICSPPARIGTRRIRTYKHKLWRRHLTGFFIKLEMDGLYHRHWDSLFTDNNLHNNSSVLGVPWNHLEPFWINLLKEKDFSPIFFNTVDLSVDVSNKNNVLF